MEWLEQLAICAFKFLHLYHLEEGVRTRPAPCHCDEGLKEVAAVAKGCVYA